MSYKNIDNLREDLEPEFHSYIILKLAQLYNTQDTEFYKAPNIKSINKLVDFINLQPHYFDHMSFQGIINGSEDWIELIPTGLIRVKIKDGRYVYIGPEGPIYTAKITEAKSK